MFNRNESLYRVLGPSKNKQFGRQKELMVSQEKNPEEWCPTKQVKEQRALGRGYDQHQQKLSTILN